MMLVRLTKLPAVALAVALGACDSTDPGRERVDVSFSTRAPAPMMAITVSEGGNTLVITKAQLVLRELELKLSTTATCEDGAIDDSCEEIEIGPLLIDLPVTDVVLSPISATAPAGTYREIEFDVRRPGTDPADIAFLAAHPEFNNVSIRVEGTWNGAAFVFRSELDQEVQIDFNPPVEITAGNNNVTIAVDIRSWFRNTGGTLINPATANPGGQNTGPVTQRIQASLRAFEDDDKSGS